ncbi:MAG: twin-arginine translocase TatA/TatE family subunit [Chloroflexi bacterium]|nr:twin-arginine translocase TatA/TatE family subunit [Chloroflexota bacterium]
MPRIGPTELVIILVIILIIFGVGRLPEIGGAMGKGIRAFKRGQSGEASDEDEKDEKDETSEKVEEKPKEKSKA